MRKKLLFLILICLFGFSLTIPVWAGEEQNKILNGEVSGLASGDLDNDGNDELIVTTCLEGYVHLFKPGNKSLPVKSQFLGSWVANPIIVQFTENQEKLLVVTDNLNQILALSWQEGKFKIVKSLPPVRDRIERIIIGDLNKDGTQELIACFQQGVMIFSPTDTGFTLVGEKYFAEKIKELAVVEGRLFIAFSERLACLTLKSGKLEEVNSIRS